MKTPKHVPSLSQMTLNLDSFLCDKIKCWNKFYFILFLFHRLFSIDNKNSVDFSCFVTIRDSQKKKHQKELKFPPFVSLLCLILSIYHSFISLINFCRQSCLLCLGNLCSRRCNSFIELDMFTYVPKFVSVPEDLEKNVDNF